MVISAGVELEITKFQIRPTNHQATWPRCLLFLRNRFVAWKGPFFVRGNRKLGLCLRSKESSGEHVDRPLLTDNTTVRAELRQGNDTEKTKNQNGTYTTQSDNGNEAIKI